MLQQLRDLIAFPDLVRLGAQVLDEYDNLATIPSINHSGVAHQTLARQARTSLHDAARSWHEFNCNSSMDFSAATGSNREVLGGIEVVADILPGMGNCR